MKVENLMIGDWVCLEDENLPLEERYFKIEYLSISAGVSWANQGTNAPIGLGNGESLIPVFRDEIYPIPLTPEILKKNGFNEEQKRVCFVVSHKEYQLTYSFNSNWFSIYKNANVSGSDYPIFICAFQERIKYVHHLQHALKLCGIDKEIVV